MSQHEETMDCAREAYLASRRGNDLISIAEAGKMVDRSASTVRKWIKEGSITTEKSKNSKGGSTTLVSREELLAYAAIAGKSAKPGRKKKQSPREMPAVLQAELEGQKALVMALKAQLQLQDSQLRLLEDSRRVERERVDEWKDRWVAADAELRALRTQLGVPWWKRLLTMEVLPGPSFIPRRETA
jgi:transposase